MSYTTEIINKHNTQSLMVQNYYLQGYQPRNNLLSEVLDRFLAVLALSLFLFYPAVFLFNIS